MDVQCGTINSRRVAGTRVNYTPQVLRITYVSLKVEIPPKNPVAVTLSWMRLPPCLELLRR